MIPEHQQTAVEKALRMAFGVSEAESMQPLTRGLSTASVFRITVQGKPYLLRIINSLDPTREPTRHFASMQAAAEAGVAPPVRYLSIDDKISITDFVENQPFPASTARETMPALIRTTHSLPKLPPMLDYFEAADNFLQRFRASGILPESATEDLFELYERVRLVYPRNDPENQVSCHNDLNPENVLFDGVRPWVVDWEAAFMNDRYIDLGVVTNFVARDEAEEAAFLDAYFGEDAGDYRRARFFLMRQILHMFYFTLCMQFGSEGKPVDVDALAGLDFRDFHDRLWNGELTLASSEAKLQYAWVHMQQALKEMRSARYEEALDIVARHSAQ